MSQVMYLEKQKAFLDFHKNELLWWAYSRHYPRQFVEHKNKEIIWSLLFKEHC